MLRNSRRSWMGAAGIYVLAALLAGGLFMGCGAQPPVPTLCRESLFCRHNLTREVAEPKEARNAVRRVAEEDVDFIKLLSDSILGPVQIERQVIQAIIDQAHQEGLKAVGHAPEAALIVRTARAGIDGFVHSPMPPSRTPDRLRELVKVLTDRGIPVTTTLYAVLAYTDDPITEIPARPEVVESQARHVAMLAEAGVPIVVGTDWCVCNVGDDPASKPGAMTLTEMKSLRWGGVCPTRRSLRQPLPTPPGRWRWTTRSARWRRASSPT